MPRDWNWALIWAILYSRDVGAVATVGRIREKLRELGIDDNTVIVFMGDNGFRLGEHGMDG